MIENKYIVDDIELSNIYKKYLKALEKRSQWEDHWNECYEYALPQKNGLFFNTIKGSKKNTDIFDSTAEAGVEQLAGSLLSQLTPPWSKWFGLSFGVDIQNDEVGKEEKFNELDRIQKILQSHFDRSNFYVEAHQCYLDLITVGTAVMLFEETQIGEASAFQFTAIPMNEIALEEGVNGKLDTVFRSSVITLSNIVLKFPDAELDKKQKDFIVKNPDEKISVIEAVLPRILPTGQHGYNYVAFINDENNVLGSGEKKILLKTGVFANSPFICFRWLKIPSEVYGRSPVMKALPDIKTANKVVELVLKNATIAVSGVWQADDDGVLNMSNINLTPGTIIPKAVGSSGLTALKTGADFDVSQLVLSDLRLNINRNLLIDQMSLFTTSKMTATEVMERSSQMSKILGATYGRLQSEFLTPVIIKAVSILKRRGEIKDVVVNGREVDLKYQSPLAQNQAARDAENILGYINAISSLGPDALAIVDRKAVALWLASTFNIPERLIVE